MRALNVFDIELSFTVYLVMMTDDELNRVSVNGEHFGYPSCHSLGDLHSIPRDETVMIYAVVFMVIIICCHFSHGIQCET